jgi:hypothetical protein
LQKVVLNIILRLKRLKINSLALKTYRRWPKLLGHIFSNFTSMHGNACMRFMAPPMDIIKGLTLNNSQKGKPKKEKNSKVVP